MTTPAQRVPGLRGVRESHAPHLLLSQFRTAAASPPPSGDVTKGLTAWGMLGNTTYGDCGPAATEHGRMAEALVSVTGGAPTYEAGFVPPTTAGTESLYFAYGRAMGEHGTQPDQGVTNATWLHYIFGQRVIEWYGELRPSDQDEMRTAMLACCGVLVAVELTSNAETQFADGEPWTITGGKQPTPTLGHDILWVAYGPTGDTFVTWGALQKAAVDWDAACITDAWAFGTQQDAERAGYDFPAIVAAINAAGGSVVQ